MSIVTSITAALKAIAPIHGLSIGRRDDKDTWRIDFTDEATVAQRSAAQRFLNNADIAEYEMAERRDAKIAGINAAFEEAAAKLTASYPASERLSWPTQEREVREWRALKSPTPYIDALAAARGIDRLDYLNRTSDKVDAFLQASALLVGTRQRYEDEVRTAAAASDGQALEAVTPVF